MLPGDRLVCAFIKPMSIGQQFKSWPLHVTIVPWFKLKVASDDFTSLLQSQLQNIAPFGAKARVPRRFGHRQANILLKNQWQPIHDLVLTTVKQAAKNRAPFRFAGRLFAPHVTHQRGEQLSEGDIFWVDKLYIVEQKGDYKEVVAELNLENENKT